jgi:hypothetical protein
MNKYESIEVSDTQHTVIRVDSIEMLRDRALYEHLWEGRASTIYSTQDILRVIGYGYSYDMHEASVIVGGSLAFGSIQRVFSSPKIFLDVTEEVVKELREHHDRVERFTVNTFSGEELTVEVPVPSDNTFSTYSTYSSEYTQYYMGTDGTSDE